jgi:hypothetical protein
MGREIRKVAPNWEHPTKDVHSSVKGCWIKRFKPLHDEAYIRAIKEWVDGYVLWERGEHPEQTKDHHRGMTYLSWMGEAPQSEDYRPFWLPEEMTWYQVYETVSEGTPCSPPCATKEELIEWLVKHGDNWTKDDTVECNPYATPWSRKSAEAFVKSEWAPSLVMEGGVIKNGYDALP